MTDSRDNEETIAASTPTPDASIPRIGGKAEVVQSFVPGDVLAGRFRIVRFIARGGMGEVYEAEDTELSSRVALKTISGHIAEDAAAIALFKREVQLAREVTHPNVCRIYDVFRHDGTTFLTMELLHGETLAERLERERRIPVEAARRILDQIAGALTAAHEAGVVHRDFKSANVMLVSGAPGSGGVRAVVTDFGLARRHQGSARDSAATVTASITGTPAYMAPEQVEGGPITPATDIYALGVVLYEMVTGERPFTGDTPLSIAVKRLKEAPTPPRQRLADLPADWERTILRCLERDPKDRFSSAADVAKALAGGRVAGSPKTRRRRLVAIGVAAVAALVLGIGALVLTRSRTVRSARQGAPASASQRRSVAVLGFKNLSARPEAAWVSTALSEMLTTDLAAGEKIRTVSGESVARMKRDLALPDADSYAKDTLLKIRTNLDAGFVIVGSYLAVAGAPIRVDLKLQDASAGETIAAVTESGTEAELAELVGRAGAKLRERLGAGVLTSSEAAVVKASLPSNADAARLYAEGLQKLGAFDNLGAIERLDKAVEADPNHALSHAALATAWSNLGNFRRAREAGEAAFRLSKGLSREDQLSVEAQYRAADRDWPRAIAAYQTLTKLFPDNLEYGLRLAGAQSGGGKGKDALATLAALRKLPAPASQDPRLDLAEAGAYYSLGDSPNEKAAGIRARDFARARGSRLLEANALYHEGWAEFVLGELEAAKTAGNRARELFAAAGDEHGVALVIADITGLVPTRRGQWEESKRLLEEGLAIARRTGDKRNEAACLNNLSINHQIIGDIAGSERLLVQALEVSKDVGDLNGAAIFSNNLSQMKQGLGDLPTSKKFADEAVGIARQASDARGLAMSLNTSGYLALAEGNLDKATKAFDEGTTFSRKNAPELLWANLSGTGSVLWERDDLGGARVRYEEALEAAKKTGDVLGMTAVRLTIADLAIDAGRPAEAEPEAQAIAKELAERGESDNRVWAAGVLARALLEQRKIREAQEAVRSVAAIHAGDYSVRQGFELTAARVAAAAGDRVGAEKRCAALLADSAKRGFVAQQLDLALALGEIEIASGKTAAGRARLEALEKEAREKGFLLIARKASRTLSSRG